jgi:uncharacterized protein (TIGR00369 family)
MTNAKEVHGFAFSQLGDEALSSEEFVELYNLSMPPGLRLMNARMVSADADQREVMMSYELDDQWVNIAGFICGGYIAQVLDQAATASATLVSGKAAPTIECKTNFLRAAWPGKLFVTGHAVQIGQSIAFTEAKAIDMNNRLVATATVTSQLISAGALAKKK